MGNHRMMEVILLLSLFGLWIPPVDMIIKKAGHSPFWALLGLIPGVNLVALYVFAFTQWPSQKSSG